MRVVESAVDFFEEPEVSPWGGVKRQNIPGQGWQLKLLVEIK